MEDTSAATEIRAPRCPICSRLTEPSFRPFCSKRCADLDLSRWFKGSYAIPMTEEDEGDGRRLDEDTPGD